MRGKGGEFWSGPDGDMRVPLVVLAGCFLAGGLAGLLLSGRTGGTGDTALAELLRTFLERSAAQAPQAAPAPALLWECVRWHLLVFVLGFTSLGLLFLPVVFALRGFLMAFSIGTFVHLFGGAGCLLALAVFGVTGAVSLPALFVLGVQGMAAARALASRFLGESRRTLPYGRTYFLRCAVCAGALCVCFFLESTAVPALVSGAAGMLTLP